jgi:hypothetical protein
MVWICLYYIYLPSSINNDLIFKFDNLSWIISIIQPAKVKILILSEHWVGMLDGYFLVYWLSAYMFSYSSYSLSY